jgi:mono/diheme cytochrome c family protein
VLLAAIATIIACSPGRYSASAFRLPPGGDAERGKAAFVTLGCNTCHQVAGTDLPQPTVQPPVPVVLGGVVDARLSDAYLVTSIIYPSYTLAPYPKEAITSHGRSRMPSFANQMTVSQLTDVVAFLQSRYYTTRREITPPITMLWWAGRTR